MEGLKLTRRWANALMEYGEEIGLGVIYQQAMALIMSGDPVAKNAPPQLGEFLQRVPPEDVESVLLMFTDMARSRIDVLPVEVISAVPLTEEQLYKLEVKLIRLTRKQLTMKNTIDPSLLGGVRIIVDNTVIDESIKRKLADMKQTVYKGVYIRE